LTLSKASFKWSPTTAFLAASPEVGQGFTHPYTPMMRPFLWPNHAEVSNLAQILNNFGNVTGLFTNFEKSLVAPI
jgi:hypothetical protein